MTALRLAEGRKRGILRRIAIFLAVMGPGMITANVDNDAGGLATYSQAGAQFGLRLLWLMIPITVFLVMVQEMVNRMGVVTGKGLSDMIRERFGVRVTFALMVLILVTNFANIMAEFAGIASAGEILGLPPVAVIPVCAALVWLLVTKASYRSVERVFLVACIFYLAYPLTLFVVGPDAGEIATAFVKPDLNFDSGYLIMAVGLLGTTIAPWMQFYQQASVAEKNIPIGEYAYSKLDTVLGCIMVSLVASCIMIVCAVKLNSAGIVVNSAADAARALEPLAGRLSSYLFAFGLLNASVFAASILPLSTSYTVCEAFGWESGVDRDFDSAPQFYIMYTALLVLGAGAVLIPGVPFMPVMFWSQVVNGIVLPVVLVFMLILVNDRSQMGDHVNGRFYNAVCIAVILLIAAVSLAMPVSMLLE